MVRRWRVWELQSGTVGTATGSPGITCPPSCAAADGWMCLWGSINRSGPVSGDLQWKQLSCSQLFEYPRHLFATSAGSGVPGTCFLLLSFPQV